MKKLKLFTTASLTLSALAIFSSCRDYDVISEEEMAGKHYLNQVAPAYTDAFVKAFGEIDPNNGFGMDEPLQRMGWGASTRAGNPGTVLTNRNQWIERVDGSEPFSSRPYRTSALAHDIVIPGWPNFDGYYYGNHGSSVLEKAYTAAELNTLGGSIHPCGDVTDYEIQYVSAWFRTHKITDPENYREELHLSDFFIQNVSCDNDQKEYGTLSNTTNQTGWNGDNVLTGNDQGHENNITRLNNSHEAVNFSLDQLGFKSMDNVWTHVNNFNNGNSNYNPEEAKTTNNREIKYITSSGTEDFRCHPSFNTDQSLEWIKSWVLVRLTWTEPGMDGKNHEREGYYLAFDFQANKQDTKVACDGYYSNWIVKITPGHFTPTGKARRIMCEDLGGTFDFDFNDVVVDVALDASNVPVISVQAAGGTMPVYLDGRQDDPTYELHKLLGFDVSQPVNVKGDYSNQHAPAIFRGKTSLSTLDDLPIYVINGDAQYSLTGNRGGMSNEVNGTHYDDDQATEAPFAFAVPTTKVKWMKELTNIEKSYVNFSSWVMDANYTYKPSNDATPLKWYEQSKPQVDDNPTTSYVYYPGITMKDGSPTGWVQTLPDQWQTLTPIAETYTDAEAVGALGSIKIYGYEGNGSIIDNFTNQGAKMVTITVILKSDLEFAQPAYDVHGVLTNPNEVIQAILIPADKLTDDEKSAHQGKTMEYQGNYFTKDVIQSWRVAQYQNYNNPDETSQILQGHQPAAWYTHTYALKMTFEKSQILTNPDNKYVDNIHFFVKVPDGKNAQIFNWHVHY